MLQNFEHEPSYFNPSKVVKYEQPFRYHVYDNFFNEDIYLGLCKEFQTRLNFGLYETKTPLRFSRSQAKASGDTEAYDAYIAPWPRHLQNPLAVMYSRQLHDFFSKEFGIPLTPDLNVAFHHHLKNSRTGFIHNDFHICNFLRLPRENGLNPSFGPVEYQGPWDDRPGVFHVYRSIALILYLHNPTWEEGDGGETGLFLSRKDTSPVAKVAPLNNRVLAFEIGPNSQHAFLSNVRNVRNSIAMWFHSECDHAKQKFGEYPYRYPSNL